MNRAFRNDYPITFTRDDKVKCALETGEIRYGFVGAHRPELNKVLVYIFDVKSKMYDIIKITANYVELCNWELVNAVPQEVTNHG